MHIAKSTLTEPLFNLQSITIKVFYVRDTFRSLKCHAWKLFLLCPARTSLHVKNFARPFSPLGTTEMCQALNHFWVGLALVNNFSPQCLKSSKKELSVGMLFAAKHPVFEEDDVSEHDSMERESASEPCTRSSPDRSRLVPLTLDYTRLARSKTNREPVRRLALNKKGKCL